MTAFARVTLPAGGKHWVVEIRSLNQRYFELSLRLPPQMFQFEPQVRQLVQSLMRRGKVSLSVAEEGRNGETRTYELDTDQVRVYLASAKKMQAKFRLEGKLCVEDILTLPGVVKEKTAEDAHTWTWPKLNAFLTKALEKAILHKEEEGRKLEKDFRLRLDRILKTTQRIESLVQGGQKIYFEKLKARVQELLNGEKLDEERLHREVAMLAERSDITEETVRMKSHLDLFGKWLARDGESGRELDFLCQEMNREANTMASKAQLFEVSKESIAVKSEIEKIREQVQNVE
ncbi:MAG TPA: YicC family protein [Candidatus Omnitrophota bacterium]|nr:YicC family protein [Candidatus Omnitrophota bacterium]HPS36493.1 YicC family protein [Candidatus Omnitrophota bacterium]